MSTFCSVQKSQRLTIALASPAEEPKLPSLLHPGEGPGAEQSRAGSAAGWVLPNCCQCLPGSLQTSLPGAFIKVDYLPIECSVPQRQAGGTGILGTRQRIILHLPIPAALSFPSLSAQGLHHKSPCLGLYFQLYGKGTSNTYPEGAELGLLNLHSMWLFKPPNLLDLVH